MTRPTDRPRASQRSRRCPVPSISMSARARRAQHPTVTLDLQQLDRYHDRAEKVLSETIAAYGKLDRDVDWLRWKCLRSTAGTRLFRARRAKSTGQTPLLCVGTLRGGFDDVMEGLYCQNTEEMLLMNAIKCPRLVDSAVLYAVKQQEPAEPYTFTGIKCATIKLTVSSNRDLCYFDKMGMVRQASGKRMAYHVMQSVDLRESQLKSSHKRVQASACYLFEELEDNLVGVYMQGKVIHAALSCLLVSAVADVLLAVTNALQCARAKKLASLVAVSRPEAWSCSSSDKSCDVCQGASSFFGYFVSCASCKVKHVCKKCRVKEFVLARDTGPTSHVMRADFCRVCVVKADSMTMGDPRDQTGTSRSVDRQTIEGESGEMAPVAEEEEVKIPGSNRSLNAFSLKVTAQLQQLSNRTEVRVSNLSSMGKASMSDEEDEIALLASSGLLRSVGPGDNGVAVLEREPPSKQRRGSHSTVSTTSSSYCDSDDDAEQFQTSLLSRLQQVSHQAEETFNLTRRQSQLAHSMLESSRRRGESSERAVCSQSVNAF